MKALALVAAALAMAGTVQAQPIRWSEEQAKDNARDLIKVIKKGEKDLKTAASLGDSEGIYREIQLPISRILQFWNDQRNDLKNPAAERFSICTVAAVDFSRFAETFRKPDGLSNRNDRAAYQRNYQTETKGCREEIDRH